MQAHEPRKGSRGLSCLTCRQRRKKCDRSKPMCERCLASGFRCLGYDTDDGELADEAPIAQSRHGVTSEKGQSNRENLRPILPKPAESVSYTRQQPRPAGRSEKNNFSGSSLDTTGIGSPLGSSHFFANTSLRQRAAKSTSEAAVSYLNETRFTDPAFDHDNTTPMHPAETRFEDPWPHNQSHSLTRSTASLRPVPVVRNSTRRSPRTPDSINELGLVMRILCGKIPRSVNANASMRASYFTFTVGQYKLYLTRKFFQHPPTWLIDMTVERTQRSRANLWFLYLGVKIFEQLNQSSRNAAVRPFVHWINKCGQEITNALDPNCPVEELENRLLGLLEVVFLKFVTVNTRAGYSLLKRSHPVFVAIVATDSSLWTERQGVRHISVARALECPRYEIRRFVFYDTMTAFALGIPSLAQYDTTNFPIPVDIPPLEWVHGTSVELTSIIAEVNSWRALNCGIPNMNDWPGLEQRVLAWVPKAMELTQEDSCEMIVRLAVQESLRQAVIIYIYMGMCCVDSHDPRIQRAVRQILQLTDIVPESPLEHYLFFPCLLAGVAARYEQQRATVRNKLSSFYDTRVWLLPGLEFATVLDHLWHGVAAGGAPVRWEDYVCSRQTVLPVT